MIDFDTQTNAAFEQLRARPPGQHWSQFDVSLDAARSGAAHVLVTTIWNAHWTVVASRRQATKPAISQDIIDGSLWYRIGRPELPASVNAASHWDRISLARERRIPIVGILKDFATSRCSMRDTFRCSEARLDVSGHAIWLRLEPARPLVATVEFVDIAWVTGIRRMPSATDATQPFVPQVTLSEFSLAFAKRVADASRDTINERRQRLQSAAKIPTRVLVLSYEYVRNADVVAEVLARADGSCERCTHRAPFSRRADGSPYLEVHHKVTLASGGDDTVSNAIALCPNCHRELHYG